MIAYKNAEHGMRSNYGKRALFQAAFFLDEASK